MFNKKTRIHNVIFILGAIGVGFLTLLFLRLRTGNVIIKPPAISDNRIYNKSLIAGDFSIPVAIAGTPALQEQGLSDTDSLPADSGMLFVFSKPDKVGFWMKDMRYPLDFVWIDSAMKIVAIDSDIAADTYPTIFYPPKPVLYVLEVNANFSTAHHLSVGQQLTLSR